MLYLSPVAGRYEGWMRYAIFLIWERVRMPERDPIDLIREHLSRLDGLLGLHSEHDAFKHWHAETKMILEKAFSPKSVHYQNFLALRFREMSVKVFASTEIDKMNAARYKKDRKR